MNRKAIALFSGGLDSVLAVRLIMDQEIEVVGLNLVSSFCDNRRKERDNLVAKAAAELGIRVLVRDKGAGYLKVLTEPRHGYGKNMNPCIDCRVYMMQVAREVMDTVGASFIVTGEVVGQRPMSQMRDTLRLIERESGLTGLIVRPLSARLLSPSEPESRGWLDRSRLLNIAGRSRKMQYDLAARFNLKNYSPPAGGCLLTDPIFSGRLRELFREEPDFRMTDVDLLKYGRHFRFEMVKVIVGRDKEENEALYKLISPSYAFVHTTDFKGPSAVMKGRIDDRTISIAGNLVSLYAKNTKFPFTVECLNGDDRSSHIVSRMEIDVEKYRIKGIK